MKHKFKFDFIRKKIFDQKTSSKIYIQTKKYKLGSFIGMTKILKYSLFLISYSNQRNEILNFGIKRNEIFRIKIDRNEIEFCYQN